jgi:hypothetical protein
VFRQAVANAAGGTSDNGYLAFEVFYYLPPSESNNDIIVIAMILFKECGYSRSNKQD